MPFALDQELRVIFTVFLTVLPVHGFRSVRAGGQMVFDPAGRVPIGARVFGYVICVPLFITQQECDAIVGSGHHEQAALAADLFGAAATEAVTQHDRFGVGLPLHGIDRFLDLFLELGRLVVQALFEPFKADDIRVTGGEVFDLQLQNLAQDNGRLETGGRGFRVAHGGILKGRAWEIGHGRLSIGIRQSQLGGPQFVAAGAPLFPPRHPEPNSQL